MANVATAGRQEGGILEILGGGSNVRTMPENASEAIPLIRNTLRKPLMLANTRRARAEIGPSSAPLSANTL